jgi:hypothetical protein
MEEDLIIEVWDVFKEYISDKNKETAAHHFIDMLIGKDIESSVLKSIMGYDPHLDDAITLATADDVEEDDFDEDDIDYDDED